MKLFKVLVAFSVVVFTIALRDNAIPDPDEKTSIPETQAVHWKLMAFKPDVELLNVKAIDSNGNRYEVKAIQYSEDISVMDVKAFVKGKVLPVKLLVKEGDRYYPLKAIDEDGTIINIKAVDNEGNIHDVKGVSKSGNIVHIRAISKYGEFFNVIAVSPSGHMADVKGLKMTQDTVEMILQGNKIFAHVKCLGRN